MNYENSRKGLNLIFWGQLLGLIGSVIAIVGVLLTIGGVIVANNAEAIDGVGAFTAAAAIVTSIMGVAVFVSYILYVVGVIKASKDEPCFKMALYMLFVAIVASLLQALFPVVFKDFLTVTFNNILNIVEEIAKLLSLLFVITGVSALGEDMGRADVVSLANKVKSTILAIYILNLLAQLLNVLFVKSFSDVIVSVITVVVAVLELAGMITYFILLNRARKMFD